MFGAGAALTHPTIIFKCCRIGRQNLASPVSETVDLETSIIAYLAAISTKNLIIAGNIETTRDWWEFRRNDFMLYTSEAVLDEVARGDTAIASQRLEILRDFPLLALNQAVQGLATQFLTRSNLPQKAKVHAIHIATVNKELVFLL